jgi:glycosyltransferase involved in cell wall biosynthesis
MKIAFINIYQESVERGSEVFVTEMSKRLSAKHEVSVISAGCRPQKRWSFLWRFYLDPHGFQTFWQTLGVLGKIMKHKFDIVIPLNGGWQPALLRLVTWVYGGKMIISGQSGKGWDDRNNLWCFPDRFIALNNHLYDWAVKVNPLVKTVVIPNGVNVDEFASEKKSLNLNLETPIILSVGALEKNKRHDLSIKAVAKLKSGSLVIIGKGSEEENLTKLGSKLLGKGRFLIKSFAHKDMPKVYKTGSLFVFPTVPWESFGIVAVEAMACGLPVVANDDPIRREIVGDAGIFVDPTQSKLYAKAISEALSKDWGNKPLIRAKMFDWDTIAEKYEEVFREIRKA